MSASAALQLVDLHRRYGAVRAVDGVDLTVQSGERFALLGPSGSGKTTILRLVAGFEQPDEGRVELAGVDVAGLPPERRNVGVVFQDYALFPHRSVADNVAFGLRMRGVDRAARRDRVAQMLDLVGLTAQADRRPDQLSGGQRQRVALARALAPEPTLLLLDEPLANLDRRLRESLRGELMAITAAVGITTVLVTHDQEEALTFADRVGVLAEGRLAQVGEPAEVWRRPCSRFVATFLGETNLLPAEVDRAGTVAVAGLAGRLDVDRAVPAGPVVACLRPEALRVVRDDAGDGVVAAITMAGGTATYRVEAGGTSLLAREIRPDGRTALAVGDTVRVTAEVGAVTVLPDDTPGGKDLSQP